LLTSGNFFAINNVFYKPPEKNICLISSNETKQDGTHLSNAMYMHLDDLGQAERKTVSYHTI
jgi:hypothetical protein